MMATDALQYCANHGDLTEPAEHAHHFAALPTEIADKAAFR
jgi:hypothetical protein